MDELERLNRMVEDACADNPLPPEKKARVNVLPKSLEYLRKRGYIAESVEHWNYHGYVKKDLFGFADIVAYGKLDMVFVQVTTYGNGRARVKKIIHNANAKKLMTWGYKILVHEWKGVLQPNGRRKWTLKIIRVNDEPEVKEWERARDEQDNMEPMPF